MFVRFERAVARRYLLGNRGEGFVSFIALLSLLAFALGTGALVIVMSVMGGFETDLLGRILGFNGHLGIYGAGAPLTDFDADVARIRTVAGVTSALPVVDGQVLLTDDRGDNTGGYVRGIRRDDLRQLHAVSDNVRAGSLDAFDGPDAIAVGVTLANRFGLAPGSKLTLVSPQGAATAFGTIPRVRAYTVTTIFQVGMNEYDSGYVFLPLDAAQIFFQQPGAVTQIEVRVDDADHARQIGRSILQALSGTPVRVIDWQQNNNSFFEAIQVEKTVMFVLLSLITGVAMLSVVNTLIMLIKDKAADIAVLRTLGAGRGAIARVFVMVGLAIGLAGTALGAVLGVLFCRNIQFLQTAVEAVTGRQVFNPTVYYLAHLPARLDPGEIFRICVISVILSALATVYPSLRAAWTDPVAALRDA